MNDKCVSVVINVILLVAIILTIASIVFIYYHSVSGMVEDNVLNSDCVGNVTDKFVIGVDCYPVYNLVIEDRCRIVVDIEEYYSFDVGDYYGMEVNE